MFHTVNAGESQCLLHGQFSSETILARFPFLHIRLQVAVPAWVVLSVLARGFLREAAWALCSPRMVALPSRLCLQVDTLVSVPGAPATVLYASWPGTVCTCK